MKPSELTPSCGQLIAECSRVAKRMVFLTTPNRWFPIEVHTALPLIHWLPGKVNHETWGFTTVAGLGTIAPWFN